MVMALQLGMPLYRKFTLSTLLLDPSISSANVGDQIIQESVLRGLDGLLEVSGSLPTQRRLSAAERRTARTSKLAIVGGTNLLSSNMPWYQQWKVGPLTAPLLRNKVILMGVGWWQYQAEPNAYTSWLLNQVLSKDHVHSVRDEYTMERLQKMGFNVLNTACPTMWHLSTMSASPARSETCIVTLTDYNKNVEEDQWLLDEVSKYYKRVVVWPQAVRDAAYAKQLNGAFELITPDLNAYDKLLISTDADYIGTRLHGGIRAFQRGHWGLIVAVDNRALEIGRDTMLPVHARGQRDEIAESIKRRASRSISLPTNAINEWKSQFSRPS
ncbi:polysaccharide pyruvyl transferase family protein [Paenarthrobacter sp. NEAU-H11]|uniref:polysaccharide pyruvyl transferase family protein n=1 Tax=Paenarthrobacter sp. NEAU-H11 TaxID=3423924 RepID=UPI003D347D4F